MFTITLFHDKIMIRKRGGIYESESFILPDFLHSCPDRKHLPGSQGTLYQSACHQQIHPEARRKCRLQAFFQKLKRRSSHRGRETFIWPCQKCIWDLRTWGRKAAPLHWAWSRTLKNRCQFDPLQIYSSTLSKRIYPAQPSHFHLHLLPFDEWYACAPRGWQDWHRTCRQTG